MVLEAAGVHARRVEAARRRGKAIPWAANLTGMRRQRRLGGGASWGEDEVPAKGEWLQRGHGGLAASKSAAGVAGGLENRRRGRRHQDSEEVGG